MGNCTTIGEVCSTQEAVVDFFARAHNNVNKHNYPHRPAWSAADVYMAYVGEQNIEKKNLHLGLTGTHLWLTQGPIDGKCQLIRSKTAECATGPPDFCKSGLAANVFDHLEACSQNSWLADRVVV